MQESAGLWYVHVELRFSNGNPLSPRQVAEALDVEGFRLDHSYGVVPSKDVPFLNRSGDTPRTFVVFGTVEGEAADRLRTHCPPISGMEIVGVYEAIREIPFDIGDLDF